MAKDDWSEKKSHNVNTYHSTVYLYVLAFWLELIGVRGVVFKGGIVIGVYAQTTLCVSY